MKNPFCLGLVRNASLAVFALLAGCKDPNDAGKEVLEDDDLLNAAYCDTFPVRMESFTQDSIYTMDLGRGMFGDFIDPDFGEIKATQFAQYRLSGSSVTFGQDPTKLTLDSIQISLDLTGYYGRFNDPLDLEVFRITENFPDKSEDTLYSNSYLEYDSSYNFAAGKKIDFSDSPGFLDFVRIRLDDSLGRALLFAPTDSLKNNTVFTSFFKGLAIRAKGPYGSTREPGGVFYLDMLSARNSLILYYKDSTSAKTYTFSTANQARHFHRIERTNYSNKLIASILADTANPSPRYAAAQAGAFVKFYLKIEGLEALENKAISQAYLYLYVDPTSVGSSNRLTPPSSLYLFAAEADHRTQTDASILEFDEGNYDSKKYRYRFELGETLARIMAGRIENNGFVVSMINPNVSLNRVILGNLGDPNLRPKLVVVYVSPPNP